MKYITANALSSSYDCVLSIKINNDEIQYDFFGWEWWRKNESFMIFPYTSTPYILYDVTTVLFFFSFTLTVHNDA